MVIYNKHFFALKIILLLVLITHGYGKIVNVGDFGAVGDGETDNTVYFQNALDSLKEEGGIVFVSAGRYLLEGTLNIPTGVALEGTFRNAPPRSLGGSVLLTTFGKGSPGEKPFIMLNTNSTLCGLVVYYPEQTTTDPPLPYPWTIRGHGDNCSIKNCLLLNSYQAKITCQAKFLNAFWNKIDRLETYFIDLLFLESIFI
jgi:hypothetical protein